MGPASNQQLSVEELGISELLEAGVPIAEAEVLLRRIREAVDTAGRDDLPGIWKRISETILKPEHPHSLHQLLYHSTFARWDEARFGPPPAWTPTPESVRRTRLGQVMEARGTELLGRSYKNPIESFPDFQKWSAAHPERYLDIALEYVRVIFHESPKTTLDLSDEKVHGGAWLPGAVFNAAESALASHEKIKKTDESLAIVWRKEGADGLPVETLSFAQLRRHVNRVANALVASNFQIGDAIGIDMPMNVHAVIAYLAIVLAGMVVVSIADSFVGPEIATRCRVSQAKAIITQDYILRGGKRFPLYSRVIEGAAPKAIVLPADGRSVTMKLRDGDITWDEFLSRADKVNSLNGTLSCHPEDFKAVALPAEEATNILFSSGTSGEPKAIPWSHHSPIRCAVDAWGHQDIRPGDVFVWPTNLGWMMGPFLIYATLCNGAAIALYHGSPLTRGYGKFVQDAGVTVKGTIPSLVKSWRKTSCMDGLDWSKVRCFCSTGEASNLDDDLWLASRAHYKAPVLECCGGTELAAAYVGGSLNQPQALAAFSTQTLSNEFVILDENSNAYPEDQPCVGEIGIVAVSFGSSTRLLNADHEKVYYTGMPMYKGKVLRRHGDIFERIAGGFYRAHGRSDDTMNLGGIKASAVEIERVCNTAHERILETAAIAISPPGGGPEQLIIATVLNDGPPMSLDFLQKMFSTAVQTNLNPLFKVSAVEVVPEFPRTASNKLLRRVLRAEFVKKRARMARL